MAVVKIPYEYKNDLDLIDVVLQIYYISHLKKPLSYKEHCCLREYLLYGYSERTKKSLITTLFMPDKTDKKDKKCKILAFNSVFKTDFKTSEELDKFISNNTITRQQALEISEAYTAICLKKGSENLNVINYSLKNKGLLVNHPTNQRLKLVSQKLLTLKENLMDKNNMQCLLIDFKKAST